MDKQFLGNNEVDLKKTIYDVGPAIDLKSDSARRYGQVGKIIGEIESILVQISVLKKFESGLSEFLNKENILSIEETFSTRHGLYFSILVRYFKLFADASKTIGYISLNVRAHLKGATEEQIAFHNYLEEMRHLHISHGIHEDFENYRTRARINKIEEGNVTFNIFSEGAKRVTISIDELNKIEELIKLIPPNLEKIQERALKGINLEMENIPKDEMIKHIESFNNYMKQKENL